MIKGMEELKPRPDQFNLSAAKWLSGSPDSAVKDPVEVAFVGDNILMRNGSDDSHVLVFTQAEWDAFVAGAKDGEFDY